MSISYEIIYKHDNGDIEVIDGFSTNMGLTMEQALNLCGVDMDEYADEQGWDGYDYNCLEFRIVD